MRFEWDVEKEQKRSEVFTMKNKIEIDINNLPRLTEAQINVLRELESSAVAFDEDNPPLTPEQLSKLKSVSELNRKKLRKETVSSRLSPKALEKARSLGKGYTSVLSRILEDILEDNNQIEKYL